VRLEESEQVLMGRISLLGIMTYERWHGLGRCWRFWTLIYLPFWNFGWAMVGGSCYFGIYIPLIATELNMEYNVLPLRQVVTLLVLHYNFVYSCSSTIANNIYHSFRQAYVLRRA